MKLVIISGRSGSGKSSSLNMLEDIGFYCIDNLPASLLPELSKQQLKNNPKNKVAVSIDARNNLDELSKFKDIFKEIPSNIDRSIIFLDANNSTLIKRFSETRRKHPLTSNNLSLSEAIKKESEILEDIADMADLNIETSRMNLHDLRHLISFRIGKKLSSDMSLLIQSFGYKNHIPIDSDIVFDVRCLKNPFWETELRPLDGRHEKIKAFLNQDEDVNNMTLDIIKYLESWLPKFKASNRSYTTVSIGCTGGKHRSVYISEQVFNHFNKNFDLIQIHHREIEKISND